MTKKKKIRNDQKKYKKIKYIDRSLNKMMYIINQIKEFKWY